MNFQTKKTKIFLAGLLLLASLALFLSLFYKTDVDTPEASHSVRQRVPAADSAPAPPLGASSAPETASTVHPSDTTRAKEVSADNKPAVPPRISFAAAYVPDTAAEDAYELSELTETEQLVIIETAKEALRNNAPEIEKKKALLEVVEVGHPQIVDVVLLALNDESSDIRKISLEGLMNVEEGIDINDPLIIALGDDDVGVTEEALNIMEQIPSPNILRSIETALYAEEPSSQIRAIGILEDVFDPRAVDLLVDKALTAPPGEVRKAAMNSLQFITEEVFDTPQEAGEWWGKNRDIFVFAE